MRTTPRKFTATNIKECEALLLDVGGTLRKGDVVLPGAISFIQALKKRGTPYYLVSNTTDVSAAQLGQTLREQGIEVEDGHIFTANTATVHHCREHGWKKVTVLGTAEQKELYAQEGLEVLPIGDSTADGIIISYTPELNYETLTAVTRQVANGTPYIATNVDATLYRNGGMEPDTGATIGFVGVATGIEPQAVTGKPSRMLVDLVADHAEVPVRRMGIIGDQLNIDIKMAHKAGLVSVLVLTGHSTHSAAETSKYRPDYIVESIDKLIPLLG